MISGYWEQLSEFFSVRSTQTTANTPQYQKKLENNRKMAFFIIKIESISLASESGLAMSSVNWHSCVESTSRVDALRIHYSIHQV